MAQFLTTAWAAGCSYAGHILATAAVILIAELLWPRSRSGMASRLRSILFWLTYIAITAPSLVLFNRLWATLGIKPLFHLDLAFLGKSESVLLQAAGGILGWWLFNQIGEFFYYWFHRAQHASPLLWRFHAVHHSLEEMTAFNSNHHFSEEILRIPFIVIPMSLLVDVTQAPAPWIWLLLMGAQGVYEHSETKLNWGFFRCIIPDNRYHRIHHSAERQHFDKNFGSATALWDLVFGTFVYPKKGEWPKVGLAEIGEPETLRDFLGRPFKPQPAPVPELAPILET